MKVSVDTIRGTASFTVRLDPQKTLELVSDALSAAQKEVENESYSVPKSRRNAQGISNV